MRINKFPIFTFSVLFISPLGAVPFLIYQLRRGMDKGACLIISIIFGFLSYYYAPKETNDKYSYVEKFYAFQDYSWAEFLQYLAVTLRPDFIFDALVFFFAKSGFSVKVLFFVITFSTIYLFLSFARVLLDQLSFRRFKYQNITLLFIILGFSLPGLFSGVRFLLAGSFFVWFLYFFVFKKNNTGSLAFLFISIFTHFSFIFFIFPVVCARFVNNRMFGWSLLFFGLVFIAIPGDYVAYALKAFSFNDSLLAKITAYTEVEQDYSLSVIILNNVGNLWFYFAFFYLIFFIPRKVDQLYVVLTAFVFCILMVYSIPVAYNRYISFLQPFFAIYIIYRNLVSGWNPGVFLAFLILYSIGFFVDLLVLRENIIFSYRVFNVFLNLELIDSGPQNYKIVD